LNPRKPLKVYLTTPYLEGIDASGATNVNVEGIEADRFVLDLSGASSCELAGKVGYLRGDISGASNLYARDLYCQTVKIDVSGAANAKVSTDETLDADVSGAASVTYYGDPRNVLTDVSGAASVRRK
jgi:hypothetical protein